jgi:hypothetical protein
VKGALAGLALALAAAAEAAVFHMKDGDRITGKILSSAGRSFRVQTPYGRLTIPRARIQKIVHDDGREEVLGPAPEPTPPPEPEPVRLVLIITGRSFWYAWDPPKGHEVDSTLRFSVSLDEEEVAALADTSPNPEDLPGAPIVNTFTFGAEEIALLPLPGTVLLDPEARPGRIVLKLELPAAHAGLRRLRIAYQVNEGTAAQPAWRDAAATGVEVDVRQNAPTFVEVRQHAGRMEFTGLVRKRMRRVETFRLQAWPE